MLNPNLNMPKVENMMSPRTARSVANQFIITTDQGRFFQSYNSLILVELTNPINGCQILLDENKWDHSKTTGKYRNLFLGETKRETEAKIKAGTYKLVTLN